jgi:hypothetical protein
MNRIPNRSTMNRIPNRIPNRPKVNHLSTFFFFANLIDLPLICGQPYFFL